jgi:GT2 family glycosyltransferase/glycosyltransferase involved in cell wall biosynthesis
MRAVAVVPARENTGDEPHHQFEIDAPRCVDEARRTESDRARNELTRVADFQPRLELTRAELAAARATAEKLRASAESRRVELVALERRLRDAEATRDVEIARLQQLIAAERELSGALRGQLGALDHDLTKARAIISGVDASVTWQMFQRLRIGLYRVLRGRNSPPGRAIQCVLRAVGRLLLRGTPGIAEPEPAFDIASPAEQASIELPVFQEPTVSLIVPLHSGAELTRAFLESVRDNTIGVAYEVILVDDAADPETKRLLGLIGGAQTVVNGRNLGYLRSVNSGAQLARGRWLVLCNNDIVVRPGWLRAMLDCAESAVDIGAVTPKYLYPDGTLSEAGAIIWRDGTGVNYGRHDDPLRPAYNYRRETDYGSAAALLVRADLFAQLGGYDERYIPRYYEDADLCFRLRESGLRVMYEPEAVVMHVEGGTAGTGTEAGHERQQEANRGIFVSRWSRTLEDVHLSSRWDGHREAVDRYSNGNVVVIDHQVPMSNRDAGSVRMVGMLRALQALGFGVTFLPDNFVPTQPYTRELQRMGVEVLYGTPDMHGELKLRGPTLTAAILSRPTVSARWLPLMRELAPAATIIYDTVDLHWIRESRAIAVNGSASVSIAKVTALRELELAMVRAADATLAVTDVERRTLEAEVPGANIRVVPMLHDVPETAPPVEGRDGIVFLGSFAHPPNADGARQLVEIIMPEVWRSLPELQVTIVGADPPPEVLALQQPRVTVTGWVEDVESLLHRSRLMVAPLRVGAGMKGKVTQSLALGLPVVTTAVGAEGLEIGADSGLLVADDPGELAARVVEGCQDDARWEQLSRGGQAAMARVCSLTIAYGVFDELLNHSPDSAGPIPARTRSPSGSLV